MLDLLNTLSAMKVLFVLITAAIFPVTALAQIYTWTDASGRVHFSDKAPANQKSATVDLPESAANSTPEPNIDESERLERQKRLVQVLEEERMEKERLKAEAKAEAEKKVAYCERFKNRLSRMDEASLLYSENKDGTVRYWEAKEADQYRVQLRNRYQQECEQA